MWGTEPVTEVAAHGSLTDGYVVPPFSVLDTRQGYWKERRHRWLSLGIQSEVGRGDGRDVEALDTGATRSGGLQSGNGRDDRLIKGGKSALAFNTAANRQEAAARRAADQRSNITGAPQLPEYAEDGFGYERVAPGTSIFDPVVAELAYRWWCPPGGSILDPFAGGSVRGIVAAKLGHPYVGVDLSARQVAANEKQADDLLTDADPRPRWIVGDSLRVGTLVGPEAFDMVFTCPPYYDLEVYSDDPSDLSAMPNYATFLEAYRAILAASVGMLRPGRFAVVVTSEVRDKRGVYRGLVADTMLALRDAGAEFYNDAVLINQVGTLAMRADKQMKSGRKLGRAHQNIICSVKGGWDEVRGWDAERVAPPDPQLSMWGGVA